MKPTKETLETLHYTERLSTEKMGDRLGYSGRRIRELMAEYGIPRLGDALKVGKSATWNVGLVRSEEAKEKNRKAHLGKTPYNKGRGSVHFNCEICGEPVFDKPYRRKHTCSDECKNERMRLLRGAKHPNFRGSERTTARRSRMWVAYREWRKAVLDRDNHTCQACNKQGGRLTPHHLYTWNDNPDKAFDLDNGVCLCWECHWSFHRACGHHHTTPEMYQEWLTKL